LDAVLPFYCREILRQFEMLVANASFRPKIGIPDETQEHEVKCPSSIAGYKRNSTMEQVELDVLKRSAEKEALSVR
jgi:hypothetical protein